MAYLACELSYFQDTLITIDEGLAPLPKEN